MNVESRAKDYWMGLNILDRAISFFTVGLLGDITVIHQLKWVWMLDWDTELDQSYWAIWHPKTRSFIEVLVISK